jgi:hypothetical protein
VNLLGDNVDIIKLNTETSIDASKEADLDKNTQRKLSIRGLTIKFVRIPPCACLGSSGQKPQYTLVTLTYQHFIVLFLIYGSLFLSGVCYCLGVFWYTVARMLELKLEPRL